MIDLDALQKEIDETIERFKDELAKIGSGKASAEQIGDVMVEAYGQMNKLMTVGQVLIEDAVNAKIQVWDKNVLPEVEKALRASDLGGSVSIDGDAIRLKFNPMTEEDRIEKTKLLNKMLEDFRVRIRKVRQDYMQKLDAQKEGADEDTMKLYEKDVQEAVDLGIETIEEIGGKKEEDLMSM